MNKFLFIIFLALSNAVAAQDAVQWDAVTEAHVGQELVVQGQVVRTYDSGKVTHINFDVEWQGKFEAIIFASAACDFRVAPADFFLGREIQIRGEVSKYKGTLQIIIQRPQDVWCTDGTQVAANALATGGFTTGDKLENGVRFVS